MTSSRMFRLLTRTYVAVRAACDYTYARVPLRAGHANAPHVIIPSRTTLRSLA